MATIILFAPLIGAIICGFGWRLIGERAGQVITTALVFLAAALSWYIFLTFGGETQQITILRWIESGTLGSEWSIRLDRLTAQHAAHDVQQSHVLASLRCGARILRCAPAG